MKTKTGSPRFVKTIALLLTCFTAFVNFAQDRLSDSLISVIGSSAHDSVKVKALISLAGKMIPEARYDSALSLADKAMQLSARHRFSRAMGEIHSIRGIVHNIRGSYPAALTNFLLALDEFEKLDRHKNVARCLMYIGIVHMYQHDYEK